MTTAPRFVDIGGTGDRRGFIFADGEDLAAPAWVVSFGADMAPEAVGAAVWPPLPAWIRAALLLDAETTTTIAAHLAHACRLAEPDGRRPRFVGFIVGGPSPTMPRDLLTLTAWPSLAELLAAKGVPS